MTQPLYKSIFFISLILFSGLIYAMPYPAYQNTYQPSPQQSYRLVQQSASPVDILEKSIRNILLFLNQSKQINNMLLKQYINREIAPNFDFSYMSRWVAGRRYYQMNKNQRKLFEDKFSKVFISSFINKMTLDKKSLPRASRFRSSRQSQTEARASVIFSYFEGQKVKVDFRFFKTAKGWKVVDVKANGLSALLYFKNYFARLIKQHQSSH